MGILEVIRKIKRAETRKIKREEVQKIKREKKIALELGREQVIHNLILKLNLSDEQICDIVQVKLTFVKKQRAKLNNNKSNAVLA